MKSFSSLQGALWGPLVADAASLGTHWIYDVKVLAERHPGGVQGFEPPAPGHYHAGKEPGAFTHYGDVALLVLESVAACGGEFRAQDFGMRWEAFFCGPDCKTYLDHSTRETLRNLDLEPGNYQNGADDNQPATVTRLAPVVVATLDQPVEAMLAAVRSLTLVTQNHPQAEACAAAHAVLLRFILEGAPFREAFEQARKSPHVNCDVSDLFELAHMHRNLDVTTATAQMGQSCPLPQTFPAALHAAWRHHDDFQTAVLETIRAGGDNAARAAMVGAWLGADRGLDGIPLAWRQKLLTRDRIETACRQLLAKVEAPRIVS